MIPLVFTWSTDLQAALASDHYRSIWKPWIAPRSPMLPLVDYVDPTGWGDLEKTARLPYYDDQLGNAVGGPRHLTTDELGLPNHPAGGNGPNFDEFDVFVTGSSFSALADDVDHNLAAQLAVASGLRVYNASWTGFGPVVGILDLLEHPIREKQTIVWAILQRQLNTSGFQNVFRRLDTEGNWKPGSVLERSTELLRRLRNWPPQLEARALGKSEIRRMAKHVAFALPVALDRGVSSSIRLTELTKPHPVSMLFFNQEIEAGYRDFDSADGAKLLGAIQRVARACSKRQVKLIVALIPDKFTFYARDIEPRLYPSGSNGHHPDLPRAPLLDSMRVALEEHGIRTIDLTSTLHAFQNSNPETKPLFRRTDSHWSDKAIEVSAMHIAEFLNSSTTSVQQGAVSE